MFNMNGPPKGYNVTTDQSNYDLITKDIIVTSNLGIPDQLKTSYRYQLRTDNINRIYKAELISATVKFNSAIPPSVINKTLLLSIPQLNGNTNVVAGNNNIGVIGDFFTQVPDNCTPLTPTTLTSTNTISLFIGARMYDSVQYYNPPIDKINQIDVNWIDQYGTNIVVDSSGSSGSINSFYFTLRIYYFQKRNNVSSFSYSIPNFAASGTDDSIFN